MEKIEFLDFIKVCMDFIKFPENEECLKAYTDMQSKLVVKAYMPMDEKVIALYEMFMELGLHLRNHFACELGQKGIEANKTFAKITEACRYIQENCDQMLTLQSVSDYVGFSTYYFSRVFKSLTSTSFLEYLTMQRIKKAQTLLADSSLSITDIAYQSGYTSISTFNRVFRKSRGCSPTEYRKYYT